MHLSFNYILIHIGNSDFGQELVREFYSLKNQLIVVGTCKKHLIQVKNQFPKIEYIVCDVKKEEDLNALVSRCTKVYPLLDIIVHSNFNRELIESEKKSIEIADNMRDAERLSIRLLPIFSKKVKSSIIFTKIEKKSLKENGQTKDLEEAHQFLELKEKSVDISVQFLELKIPISFLRLENKKLQKKATHKIHSFLKDCKKGHYNILKEKNTSFTEWLKRIKPSHFCFN